jgi:tRNA dimethylallyltransferase
MAQSKYLIVIGGPTASGKTTLSLELATHFQTEILSADSRQFFREMELGTAKPTAEELSVAPHHFINSRSIFEPYSVGDFERDALAFLEEFYKKNDLAILVGGSGLYIRALCEGLDKFPDVAPEIKQQVIDDFDKNGIEFLQKELAIADPIYYAEVDRHNVHRLMRALSVCRASGQPFSSFRKKETETRPFTPIYILTEMDRAILYDKINRRVDLMVENGLIEEAKNLLPHKHLTALQTVGYQEFFDYFAGNITQNEAIELVKRNSRRYAKRQMTWYRKNAYWNAFSPTKVKEIIAFVEQKIH